MTSTSAPGAAAGRPTGFQRLVGLHVGVGEAGLRLALLQGLWLLHVLVGGVLLGLAPATAAVVAVLRRDRMVAEGWVEQHEREGLWREFHGTWRRELRPANALGALLAAGWAVWLYDLWLLRAPEDGVGGALAAGAPPLLVMALTALLWVLGAVLLAVTAVLPVLSAHLDGGALVQLRRAVLVVAGRPLVGLGGAAVLLATGWLYTALPGVGAVFGVSLPVLVLVRLVWRVLPAPAGTRAAA